VLGALFEDICVCIIASLILTMKDSIFCVQSRWSTFHRDQPLLCVSCCRWATQEPRLGATYDGVHWDPPPNEAYKW